MAAKGTPGAESFMVGGDSKSSIAKGDLQSSFLDWKRRSKSSKSKAQPKSGGSSASSSKGGASDSKASGDGAKRQPAEAKSTKTKKVKQAKDSDDADTLLNAVLEWYTTDPNLRSELSSFFENNANTVPPIDVKVIADGEYPVELHAKYQEYTAVFEELVVRFVESEGGTLRDLYTQSKDESDVHYSDAWVFVTLFTACTTFKFFADMMKQAQEGDLDFDTTAGLNPRYNV